jgi:hypothetical protein
MDKAEGFRRIGKVTAIVGWAVFAMLAILAVYNFTRTASHDPVELIIFLLIGAVFLGLCKGIEWIIVGFTGKKT